MQFYLTSEINNIGLNLIQDQIFEWKIKNIVTYMDSITYQNDNNITFSVEINDNKYNFQLNIIYDTLDQTHHNIKQIWHLEFADDLNHQNQIHIKILEMIDIINITNNNISILNLSQTMSTIEDIIDKFDFDIVNDDSDEDQIERLFGNNSDNELDNLDDNLDIDFDIDHGLNTNSDSRSDIKSNTNLYAKSDNESDNESNNESDNESDNFDNIFNIELDCESNNNSEYESDNKPDNKTDNKLNNLDNNCDLKYHDSESYCDSNYQSQI
jgi:hypothetical protein